MCRRQPHLGLTQQVLHLVEEIEADAHDRHATVLRNDADGLTAVGANPVLPWVAVEGDAPRADRKLPVAIRQLDAPAGSADLTRPSAA